MPVKFQSRTCVADMSQQDSCSVVGYTARDQPILLRCKALVFQPYNGHP
jgi:hypothetical protein